MQPEMYSESPGVVKRRWRYALRFGRVFCWGKQWGWVKWSLISTGGGVWVDVWQWGVFWVVAYERQKKQLLGEKKTTTTVQDIEEKPQTLFILFEN